MLYLCIKTIAATATRKQPIDPNYNLGMSKLSCRVLLSDAREFRTHNGGGSGDLCLPG